MMRVCTRFFEAWLSPSKGSITQNHFAMGLRSRARPYSTADFTPPTPSVKVQERRRPNLFMCSVSSGLRP
ncbi:MAG: hypothetical protein ACYSTZ_00535, partial [Planctomycetota bacterium]